MLNNEPTIDPLEAMEGFLDDEFGERPAPQSLSAQKRHQIVEQELLLMEDRIKTRLGFNDDVNIITHITFVEGDSLGTITLDQSRIVGYVLPLTIEDEEEQLAEYGEEVGYEDYA